MDFRGAGRLNHASASPVEGKNQREEPPGRIEIELQLPREPFDEEFGGFVVETPAAHVDGLDLGGRRAADRLVVALADHLVVTNDLPEGREGEVVRDDGLAPLGPDLEAETLLHERN